MVVICKGDKIMNKLERKHLEHKHTRNNMLWVGFHTASGTGAVKKTQAVSYRMKLEEEKLKLALKGEWK
jgi:hypothetical protein